jgi:hypothetical protein
MTWILPGEGYLLVGVLELAIGFSHVELHFNNLCSVWWSFVDLFIRLGWRMAPMGHDSFLRACNSNGALRIAVTARCAMARLLRNTVAS